MTHKQGFSLSHVAAKLRGLALALVAAGAPTLALADQPGSTAEGAYLALGDSVVFGFITQSGNAFRNDKNFIGYPSYVGGDLRLEVANASCAGETTGGFMSPTAPDNGCRGYRANFPLHVANSSTQMAYALNYLATNKKTRLVSISLGANDAFLLQAACGGNPACIQAGLPATLGAVYANMSASLSALRATGYRGVLMVVNYYSVDYTDAANTGVAMAINQTLANAAAANSAVVADAFSAFQAAAAAAGGKTCAAGLLNPNPANQWVCDVHPSQSGQLLLAGAVKSAYALAARGRN